MKFTHESWSQRVHFASGEAASAVGAELSRLGVGRVMLIAGQAETALAQRITAGLPVVVRHTEVAMHVPVEVAERARTAAEQHGVDALVCVGGGSTTGLAKAVALTSGLPIVAVPTTYAGSEATSVWGLTEGARKTTGVDARVLPAAVVYDATLTTSLPVPTSVASGLNALAHCVDSMWGPHSDPIARAFAAEGITALRAGLLQVVADPVGLAGREQALYAAYLSAVAFASAGSGLHHKICHVLGGKYDLPHAQTHAVMLPYVLAYNGPAAPEAERRITAAFGSLNALDGLQQFRAELDAPRALGDYGFSRDDIDEAAEAILPFVPANNPREVSVDDLRVLLETAQAGLDPATLFDQLMPHPGHEHVPAARARKHYFGSHRRGESMTTHGSAPHGITPRQLPSEIAYGEISVEQQQREQAVFEQVLASFAHADNPRLKYLMQALTRHLHAFLREVRLTEAEWNTAIEFLTAAGHITDERRQEFILLSDVLGASMQTIAINNEAYANATEATVFGPFFVAGSPEIPCGGDISGGADGEPCWVEGTVTDTDGNPVPGALIEVWEADEDGFYDVQYSDNRTAARGHLRTAEGGGYRFWALTPTPYPIPHDGPVGQLLAAVRRSPMRASHLHFMVSATGLRTLVTHIFVRGDELLASDAVFGVKESLIMDFTSHASNTPTPDGRDLGGRTWSSVRFDIVLAPAGASDTATPRGRPG